MRKSAKNKNH